MYMYNFSGIIHNIIFVGGGLFVIGGTLLAFSKFWNKRKLKRKLLISAFGILIASIIYIGYYGYICYNPNIVAVNCTFISENRQSRGGSIFTHAYVFLCSDGNTQKLYLDSLSKDKIYADNLNYEDAYVVYYEKSTKIIVRIKTEKPDDFLEPTAGDG